MWFLPTFSDPFLFHRFYYFCPMFSWWNVLVVVEVGLPVPMTSLRHPIYNREILHPVPLTNYRSQGVLSLNHLHWDRDSDKSILNRHAIARVHCPYFQVNLEQTRYCTRVHCLYFQVLLCQFVYFTFAKSL